MKLSCRKPLFFLLAVLLGVAGCATQNFSPPPAFQVEPIETGMWKQKADHLVFVLDASSSMLDGANGIEKFALARNVVANFNQTMPDLNLQTLMRSFGHDENVSTSATLNLYGPAAYSRRGVADALAKVPQAGGPSPLDKALRQTAADLKGTEGDIAMIIVSDGKDMGDSVMASGRSLKNLFDGRLCIYSVQVGDDQAGRRLLSDLSALTDCGNAMQAGDLTTGGAMAAFVKQALLSEQSDSDADGVPDMSDRCPATPRGVPVDSRGCPKDTDGDGVYDHLDRCPNSPAGVRVDKSGCPLPQATKSALVTAAGTWIFKGVQFENNSAELKPSSYPVLEEIVAGLKEQPDLKVEIQGHTDSRGSRDYNMALSQRRAESVMAYLTSHGIAADRLTAAGHGPDRPIASNNTAQGRAENRRVEFKPVQ